MMTLIAQMDMGEEAALLLIALVPLGIAKPMANPLFCVFQALALLLSLTFTVRLLRRWDMPCLVIVQAFLATYLLVTFASNFAAFYWDLL